MASRIIPLSGPLSLRHTFGSLCQGKFDPCARWVGDALWRATRTPLGPATVTIALPTAGELKVSAFGPGADWALDLAFSLPGEVPPHYEHPLVEELRRHRPGLRIPKTCAVFESLMVAVLAQRVTGLEAVTSWSALVRQFAERAPVPVDGPALLLPPLPEQVASLPYWAFHRMGVERKRAVTLQTAAKCARRIEEAADMAPDAAAARLTTIPGIGPWSAAEVGITALGDANSVSVGDFHLKNQVGWALAGEVRSTDERMLELLEPFEGQRGHVARLIATAHPRPPAFGPRYSPLPLAVI